MHFTQGGSDASQGIAGRGSLPEGGSGSRVPVEPGWPRRPGCWRCPRFSRTWEENHMKVLTRFLPLPTPPTPGEGSQASHQVRFAVVVWHDFEEYTQKAPLVFFRAANPRDRTARAQSLEGSDPVRPTTGQCRTRRLAPASGWTRKGRWRGAVRVQATGQNSLGALS